MVQGKINRGRHTDHPSTREMFRITDIQCYIRYLLDHQSHRLYNVILSRGWVQISQFSRHTLCLKNDTDVAHYNFSVNQPILIIFGS